MRGAILLLFAFTFYIHPLKAQGLYFPPTTGTTWDTIAPETLGWCQDSIDVFYNYLDSTKTKAFIVLKDGKIVLEKYFGTFVQDSIWYWASAGKSLTATLVGIAQQNGDLDIHDRTSDYLGRGWTSLDSTREDSILLLHQLTMTTGLDDQYFDCLADTCLLYKAAVGTRWAYHNGPYTLLHSVMEAATGTDYNVYTYQKLTPSTGITGAWVWLGDNHVFFSTARSFARFGLLTLNHDNWNGTAILTDTAYYNAMVNTSQNLNLSYGYLWWLNGKSSYIPPGISFSLPGMITPNAPADMYSAAGKNGQFCCVVPSQNLVLVRMGEATGNDFVPVTYLDDIWEAFNKLSCQPIGIDDLKYEAKFNVYPNPTSGSVYIELSTTQPEEVQLFSLAGQLLLKQQLAPGLNQLQVNDLKPGMYIYKLAGKTGKLVIH